MYYKIGTLAKRFGITTQALRFYEEQGFLVSTREESSSTRRYQTRNLKWLSSIRRYHDLGFGMEEIQELFSCEEPDQIKNMVIEKEKALQKEIDAMEKRKVALQQHQTDLNKIKDLLYQCVEESSPCLWLLIDQIGQKLDDSKEMEQVTQVWLQNLMYVYSASVVSADAILEADEDMERKSGYCIEERMGSQLNLPMQGKVMRVQYKNCIHTVTKLCEDAPLMEHVKIYTEKHHLQIAGDAVGRCLVKVGESHCQDGQIMPKAVYYEYWIPVQEMEERS
jgi:DNA-binding transcriptional MerR regulator